MATAPQPPPPVWEAALHAVATAERGAVRAWEALVPLMLAPYPTRAAAAAAAAAAGEAPPPLPSNAAAAGADETLRFITGACAGEAQRKQQ